MTAVLVQHVTTQRDTTSLENPERAATSTRPHLHAVASLDEQTCLRRAEIAAAEIESYARHALAANGFGGATIGRNTPYEACSSAQLHQEARAFRSAAIASGFAALLRKTGAFIRRKYAEWQQRRQAHAVYMALYELDAHTLHDLGFERSELSSVAAELSGAADRTRVGVLNTVRATSR